MAPMMAKAERKPQPPPVENALIDVYQSHVFA
jgi:hypothetical protein